MPEGPEVRRHADALHNALCGEPLVDLTARTRQAKTWLVEHGDVLMGKRVEQVVSHGKNLVGRIENGFYFYSHLMMWGRWHILDPPPPVLVDRRERARIVVPRAVAVLFSAPVFELGDGDPWIQVPYLRQLGPDILPYSGPDAFDKNTFLERLQAPPNHQRAIGAVLLDQTIVAGVGNYLRAEILFSCRLDPWRQVADLTPNDIACLCRTLPEVAARAYQTDGSTVSDEARARMRDDRSLVYPNSTGDWSTRHWVFRRTNLPCLVCGGLVRQKRQTTQQNDDGDEKQRLIYFCPVCQNTSIPLNTPARPRAARAAKALSQP